MEGVPEHVVVIAESISWPEPNEAGETTLDKETLGSVRGLLSGLIGYIEVQLKRCKVKDAPPAETTSTP